MADLVVSQITINKDADRQFGVRLQNSDGSPFNLTGVTEIEAFFQIDNSAVPLRLTMTDGQIVPDPNEQGRVTIILTRTQTVTLTAGDSQSFEMLITIGSQRSVVQFNAALIVVERLFPGQE